MAAKVEIIPVVDKFFCSSSRVILVVRRRPHVVTGGGFVVTDCSQRVVFRLDDCGVLGKKEKLILRDGHGTALLHLRRKAGIIEALRNQTKWKGYAFDSELNQKLTFILKEPKSQSSCPVRKSPIRISTGEASHSSSKKWTDFEIRGNFPDRDCCFVDSSGKTVAQVGVREEVEEVMENKDLFHVVVEPGVDQAFVMGVIAILDYMYDGRSRC